MNIAFLLCLFSFSISPGQPAKPFVPVGIFIGSIEEGARIFTPVRLVPFGHPEGLEHQFPTALQLYATEFDALLWLGQQAGYKLRATLQRYPKQPSPDWPYAEFAPPPDTATLGKLAVIRKPAAESPLPGLRAVVFMDGNPVCSIVDTRNYTLKERGMRGATSMGLDIDRATFLNALGKAFTLLPGGSSGVLVFERAPR